MNKLRYFEEEKLTDYFAYFEAVIDRCPVRLVAASYNKHPWPYRLQHAGECYDASFKWGNVRILDSGFNNPDITNRDVLEKAVERGATEVVAKDYVGDREATTESLKEFIELHDPDEHPVAWVPLQPPYDEHYRDVRELVENSHLQPRYMLGGLARESTEERIEQLLAFREVAGRGPVVHGLGWGLQDELVELIRAEPWVLDSLDNSTPSKCIQHGDTILDAKWNERDFDFLKGEYRDAIGGLGELLMWFQAAHRLTPFSNEEFKASDRRHPDQTALPGVGDD